MTRSRIEMLDGLPPVEDYLRLREAVGWSTCGFQVAEQALAASLLGVYATKDGEIVGAGRIIGDGVMYAYVQDLMIHPHHQGAGIGSRLLDRLRRSLTTSGYGRTLLLVASDEVRGFYEKHGFNVMNDRVLSAKSLIQ